MIDRHAGKKLRESLQRDGLVETLVVNRRDGVLWLVSGHQRLSKLDEEANGQDYSLDVAVIEVDEARERELLIRLNNPGLQGSYDFSGLEKLLADQDVKLDARGTGFDDIDLAAMFPEQDASGLFDAKEDAAQQTIDEMKAWKKEKKKRDKARDSAEFYVAFVARDPAHVERFLRAIELDPHERFHDLTRLAARMGVSLEE